MANFPIGTIQNACAALYSLYAGRPYVYAEAGEVLSHLVACSFRCSDLAGGDGVESLSMGIPERNKGTE